MALSRPRRWPRWVRYAVSALAALAVLAAAGVIGYRVLAPAETSVPAGRPYPDKPAAAPTRYGELTAAPLIVDGRLRIFADGRRVWADEPITFSTEATPYWSYRRWPAEVAGVVAVDGPFEGATIVVAKYTDGVLVAINPRTGRVAWQERVRAAQRDRYEGRRTGARTVYQPAGLFTARSSMDGSPVLVAAGSDQVVAFDPWTGERRWEQVFTEHPGCHDTDWTGETTYVAKDSCAAPAVLQIFDAATGRSLGTWQPPGASAGPAEEANWYVEPASCFRGHSRCGLVRAAAVADVISSVKFRDGAAGVPATVWRLNHDGAISPERYARSDQPYLLGEALIEPEINGHGYVHAVTRATGEMIWRSTEPIRLAAVSHLGVYGITRDFRLVVLHPTTGVELSRTDLRRRSDEEWVPGYVHVAGRFVAVERTTGGSPIENDDRYYYGLTPVVLAGV